LSGIVNVRFSVADSGRGRKPFVPRDDVIHIHDLVVIRFDRSESDVIAELQETVIRLETLLAVLRVGRVRFGRVFLPPVEREPVSLKLYELPALCGISEPCSLSQRRWA
jgi:hypothetical protein